ncbi:MAG: FMN-binding protein [Pseudoflavonifractor sp.]
MSKEVKAAKPENKTWKLIAPIVVLVVICFVATTALAFTNQATAPVILEAQVKAAEAALKVVLPEGSDFAPVEGTAGLPANIAKVNKAGNDAGYVFEVKGKGFGGDITAAIGIGPDGKITGSKVLVHAETEGIGTKVVGDGSPYQAQLIGMSDTSGIEATSGASVSSNAVKTMVEDALNAYTVITGGTVEVKIATAPESLTDAVMAQYYQAAAFTEVPGGRISDAGTVVYGCQRGMESDVKVAVLFDAADKILGITVDAMNETPDFGTKCGEPAFTDLFAGITSADEVDGISGATVTSDAVKTAVNAAIANLATVKGAA